MQHEQHMIISNMDSVFNTLDDTARTSFLQTMIGSLFGCSYICLWSYLPINTCLIFKDGCYQDQAALASTSSGGPSSLFEQYCHQPIFLLHQNDFIPGLAFQHNLPYMEINDMVDLLRMASSDVQRQFYQEARIKKTVFLGCNSGEIELGFSIVNPQINMEMEMRTLFPDDFVRKQSTAVAGDQIPRPPVDPNPPNSSSSSSFRSLSPEYSSLLFNNINIPETTLMGPMSGDPIQEAAIRGLARFRSPRLPTLESEQAQMIRAILAVLSSSSPPQASTQNNNVNNVNNALRNPNATAFERYSGSRGRIGVARRSMFKRSISYFRGLNVARMSQLVQGQGQGYNRPSATQIHHVMSERRRREKLNDSFQALRSLLPPGSKKDKASVLSSTREYLSSLRAQVSELRERNRELEATRTCDRDGDFCPNDDDDENVDVRIRHVSEATTSSAEVELVVRVRGGSVVELVMRVLEFIKGVNNVSLVSIQANHRLITDSTAVNRVVLTLNVQGSEWDESGFQEAVKRVVSDY